MMQGGTIAEGDNGFKWIGLADIYFLRPARSFGHKYPVCAGRRFPDKSGSGCPAPDEPVVGPLLVSTARCSGRCGSTCQRQEAFAVCELELSYVTEVQFTISAKTVIASQYIIS